MSVRQREKIQKLLWQTIDTLMEGYNVYEEIIKELETVKEKMSELGRSL
jgi:Fe2+ or Zn2+ uptake regulation protein